MAGVVSNSLKIMTEPVPALLFQQSPVTVRQISGRHNQECPERSPRLRRFRQLHHLRSADEALGVCPGMHIGGDLKAVVPPRIPFRLNHDLIGPGELDLYHGRLAWSGRCRTHHADRSKFAGVAGAVTVMFSLLKAPSTPKLNDAVPPASVLEVVAPR